MVRAVDGHDLFKIEAEWNGACAVGPDEIEVAITIEAGKYRQPAPKPRRAVMWVVDCSWSMTEDKAPSGRVDDAGNEILIPRIEGAKDFLCSWLARAAADEAVEYYVCLVAFAEQAVLRFGFEVITPGNLQQLQGYVDGLAAEGSTDAIAGLREAFEQIKLLEERLSGEVAKACTTLTGEIDEAARERDAKRWLSHLQIYLVTDGEVNDPDGTLHELKTAAAKYADFDVVPSPEFGFVPIAPTTEIQDYFTLLMDASSGDKYSPNPDELFGDLKAVTETPSDAQTRFVVRVPDSAAGFVPVDEIKLSKKLARTFQPLLKESTPSQRAWKAPLMGVSESKSFTVKFLVQPNPTGVQSDVHVLDILLETDRTGSARSELCHVQIRVDRVRDASLDEPPPINPRVRDARNRESVAGTANRASVLVRESKPQDALPAIREEQVRIERETSEGEDLSWVFTVLLEAERRLCDTARSKKDPESVARFLDLVVEALESGKISAALQKELPKFGAKVRRSVARAFLRRTVAKITFRTVKVLGPEAGKDEGKKVVEVGWVQEVIGAAQHNPEKAKEAVLAIAEAASVPAKVGISIDEYREGAVAALEAEAGTASNADSEEGNDPQSDSKPE